MRKTQDPEVIVQKVEVDQMQSFVGKKSFSKWLWHAIDHQTGAILAFVLARSHRRTDQSIAWTSTSAGKKSLSGQD